jgi:hypothetical protein
MTRSRRRTLALTVSAAFHLLAFAVLTPVVAPHVRTRLASYEPPAIQVQLIRLRDGLGRTSPPAPDELSALALSAPGAPQPPPPPVPPPEDEDESADPSVVAQNSPLDIEPLFRVPFRDAAGQAEAALRAGLSCAHVDLQQLPRSLLDRCAAAAQRRGGGVLPDGSGRLG